GTKHGVATGDKHTIHEAGADAETQHHHVHVRREHQWFESVVARQCSNDVAAVGDSAVVHDSPTKSPQFTKQQPRELTFASRGRVNLCKAAKARDEAFTRGKVWRHLPIVPAYAIRYQVLGERAGGLALMIA